MEQRSIGGSKANIQSNSLHPWAWEQQDYNDSAWENARELVQGNHNGLDTWIGTPWLLKAREIPAREHKLQDLLRWKLNPSLAH